MKLPICEKCEHGSVKNGRSHCGKEAIYSHLTGCIKQRALNDYLARQAGDKAVSWGVALVR